MRQIVFDTETTGLVVEQGHRIIEIGCIELINRKLTGKRYHQYINPLREIEQDAQTVHGITNQFLQDKPTFEVIAGELLDFISGAELIIHNAPFDIGFLNYQFNQINKKWKSIADHCRIIDTLVLARQLHVGQRNSLDALCKRYGIDNSQRDLHGALMDAHLLAQVYLAMTGGQGSLFDELQSSESSSQTSQTIATSITQERKLRVLKATPEEMIQHQEKLEKMIQKGKCLWLEK